MLQKITDALAPDDLHCRLASIHEYSAPKAPNGNAKSLDALRVAKEAEASG